jgi:hypothetical protein
MPENVSDSHPEFEPAAAGPSARAESPTRAVLPVANQTLAARLLGLMALAAMPRGDPGIDAQGQAPGARDPLASLLGDLAQAGQADAPDGWRTLALPLGQDPAQALWIHVRMEDQARRDGGDSPDRVEDRPRRALFDIDFSHLGRCQLDAHCQGRRFDLVMATERAIPGEDWEVIAALYLAALDGAGLGGELRFRAPGHLIGLQDERSD